MVAAVSAESTGDPVLPGSDAEKQKSDSASSVKGGRNNRRCKGWLFAISQFDAKRLEQVLMSCREPIPPPVPVHPEGRPVGGIAPRDADPLPRVLRRKAT